MTHRIVGTLAVGTRRRPRVCILDFLFTRCTVAHLVATVQVGLWLCSRPDSSLQPDLGKLPFSRLHFMNLGPQTRQAIGVWGCSC